MGVPDYFLSCDWGTSNFRLRLIDYNSLQILEEVRSDQGVKVMSDKFERRKEGCRSEYFVRYLESQLQKLPESNRNHTIVTAGMASSNIGIKELPYAELPIDLDGGNLVWEHLSLSKSMNMLLISGAKSKLSMMRGEEIQAIGLERYMPKSDDAVLLLPGTHSKHIHYKKGQYVSLNTYMTGELFAMLCNNSLLAKSVKASKWCSTYKSAYEEGVYRGLDGKMSSGLFSTRARDILEQNSHEENFFYLSGLLIGDELSSLKWCKHKVILAAPRSLYMLYSLALGFTLPAEQYVLLDDSAQQQALLLGQRKIFNHYHYADK